ncbi:uncharacterized protein [Apostichopus japonicus]|uniref:uncharacterized protein n=1 Tax=Stichopus japonicus TaxID=307972 RepID=UPI003AB909CB
MAELRSKCIFVFAVLLLLNSNGFRVSSSTRVNDSNLQYFLFQTPEYPRDCYEVLNQCSSTNAKSGVYLIKPDQYPEPFQTYCDHNTTSGGWTIIQRRVDGSIGFNRTWNEYKNGIGFLGSEFLIGNEKLAYLINQQRYQLRIELENYAGQSYSLTYDNFRIADEWGKYSITSLGGVEGITDLPITWCSSNKDNYDNTCERTCENPNDCVRPDPAEPERCLCPENHMIFGDSCIPQEQCGCYVRGEGVVLAEGEFYINSRCTRRSTCSNNQIIEASYQCSDHAICDERNGVRKCYCNQNYQGDGVTCTHNCFVAAKRSVLREGEFYINSRCTRRSTCSNNHIIETSYQCSDHATCDERNGVRKCYCNQNYQGDGVTCTHNCFVAAKRSVLREGESYINSDCSLRITCTSNVLTSERYSCSADATCEERNNIRRCYCNEWFEGDGLTCTRSGPRDCSDLHTAGRRNNGKYTIYPAGSSGFEVFCEFSSGGWTVITQWQQIQDIDLVRTIKTMMDRVPSIAQKNTEVAGGILTIVIRALPATATHLATA